MQTVLVTGAAGGIGTRLRPLLKGVYPKIRLSDLRRPAELAPDETFVEADGVSKAFGEALGALYAFKYGLRVTCIRIGNFADAPVDLRRLSIWVAPQDLLQLIRIGLEHPDIRHEIFYGASDNARGWWDNSAAFRLGYTPQARAEEHSAAALAANAKLPPDPVGEWYQGGPFCSEEFSDGLERAAL